MRRPTMEEAFFCKRICNYIARVVNMVKANNRKTRQQVPYIIYDIPKRCQYWRSVGNRRDYSGWITFKYHQLKAKISSKLNSTETSKGFQLRNCWRKRNQHRQSTKVRTSPISHGSTNSSWVLVFEKGSVEVHLHQTLFKRTPLMLHHKPNRWSIWPLTVDEIVEQSASGRTNFCNRKSFTTKMEGVSSIP